jgi:hypothetical protein
MHSESAVHAFIGVAHSFFVHATQSDAGVPLRSGIRVKGSTVAASGDAGAAGAASGTVAGNGGVTGSLVPVPDVPPVDCAVGGGRFIGTVQVAVVVLVPVLVPEWLLDVVGLSQEATKNASISVNEETPFVLIACLRLRCCECVYTKDECTTALAIMAAPSLRRFRYDRLLPRTCP